MNDNSNHGLWTKEGGKFSVSSINIVIGQLSLTVWIALFIVHGFFAIIQSPLVLNKLSELVLYISSLKKLAMIGFVLSMVLSIPLAILVVFIFCKGIGGLVEWLIKKTPYYESVHRDNNKPTHLYELHDKYQSHYNELVLNLKRKKIKKQLRKLFNNYKKLPNCIYINESEWKENLFWNTTEKDLKKFNKKYKKLKEKFDELNKKA